jgi:hypothetical protein
MAGHPVLSDPSRISNHHRVADYHSLVAKAVNALNPNTRMARQHLYERARSALIAEMESAFPPFHGSEVAAAKMALESAIEKVEADAATASRSIGRSVAEPTSLLAPCRNIELRGSLKKRWTGIIRRAAGSEKVPKGHDTWLTELLARASYDADNDCRPRCDLFATESVEWLSIGNVACESKAVAQRRQIVRSREEVIGDPHRQPRVGGAQPDFAATVGMQQGRPNG